MAWLIHKPVQTATAIILVNFVQGSHIKIHMNEELPVQVDGEPWEQSPCDIVVLKSALKVRKQM